MQHNKWQPDSECFVGKEAYVNCVDWILGVVFCSDFILTRVNMKFVPTVRIQPTLRIVKLGDT